MKIIILSDKSRMEAGGLVPPEILREKGMTLACMADDKMVGVITLGQKEYEWIISWIYVKEEYREREYGTKLLEAATEVVRRKGGSKLSIVYGYHMDGAPILGAALSKCHFYLRGGQLANVKVTREQLTKASFMSTAEMEDGKSRIVSLRHIEPGQLQQFIRESERRGWYIAGKADYSAADARKSMALLDGNRIAGIILVEQTEVLGKYMIPVLAVEKKFLGYAPLLFREAAKAGLAEKSFKEFEFACAEQSVLNLAEKIFPEKNIEHKDMIIAERWLQTADGIAK